MSPAALRWMGRGLALLAVVVVTIALGRGLGLRWDPLGWEARREAAREQAIAHAQSDAQARGLEVQGERRQAERRLDAQTRVRAAADAVGRFQAETKGQDDAPLDINRRDRLRDLDRELCGLAPELEGCAPAP
ncbi:hypothetical protein [Brevundimonas lutea]|uniref:hypothetical protein n=1 Tax=Brevundimonas lutea TaxID=2293980 RepID=UPI0013CF3B82|nr:hypothetical protein [Brevundimonas lutea]